MNVTKSRYVVIRPFVESFPHVKSRFTQNKSYYSILTKAYCKKVMNTFLVTCLLILWFMMFPK